MHTIFLADYTIFLVGCSNSTHQIIQIIKNIQLYLTSNSNSGLVLLCHCGHGILAAGLLLLFVSSLEAWRSNQPPIGHRTLLEAVAEVDASSDMAANTVDVAVADMCEEK